VRIATTMALAAILLAAPSLVLSQTNATSAASSSTTPPDWDSQIPVPKGAVLISSTKPKVGVVHSATFEVAGDYQELVDFYEKAIPKAGFQPGPKVVLPARKVYNRSFTHKSALDSVSITPSTDHPGKFSINITYTPVAK